jgi:hydroxyacylglutathione hydrolase
MDERVAGENNMIWETRNGYKITPILTGRSNVFLLSNGEKNILIDAGCAYKWPKLSAKLAALGITFIDALIITHTHFDHVQNAAEIRDKYQAKVIVHQSEAGYLRSGNSPLPAGTILPTYLLKKLSTKRFQRFIPCKGCESDILVDYELDLTPFGFKAYLLSTPGHSAGSMSIIVDNEVAIVGDAMFGVFPGSVFPPFADDVRQLVVSWKKLLDTGCKVFVPGHGSANSRALLQRCYDKRKNKVTG